LTALAVAVGLADCACISVLGVAIARLAFPLLRLHSLQVIALVAGSLLILALSIVFEVSRRAHSLPYLAKWIDDTNQLNDHFLSVFDFADQQDPFVQACVAAYIERERQRPLVLPHIPLRPLWRIAPAVLLAGVVVGLELRPPAPPKDDGRTVGRLDGRVNGLKLDTNLPAQADPALVKQANAIASTLQRLSNQPTSKQQVVSELSQLQHDLDQIAPISDGLAEAAARIAAMTTVRANDVAQAFAAGDQAHALEGMSRLAEAVAGSSPALSNTERTELARVLEQQASAAQSPSFAAQMRQLAKDIRSSSDAAGTVRLAQDAARAIPTELASEELARRLRSGLAKASSPQAFVPAAGAASAPGDGGARAVATGRSTTESSSPGEDGLSETGVGGAGRGSAVPAERGVGLPEKGASELAVSIGGKWTNSTASKLMAASVTDADARTSVRAILTTQRRMLEEATVREEIPSEYVTAIRTYFFRLIKGREESWRSNKSSNP
jgi:hypothetical protein